MTSLRKVGGSIMLALPPAILDMLNLKPGAPVGVTVSDGKLLIEPAPRPRYTLAELLAASDYTMPQPPQERECREQQGHRPVLILSPEAFNQATKLPIVLPITNGGDFARRIGYAVAISGIKTTGFVRCDQPLVLDLDARHGRHTDVLPQAILDDVLARIATIFA
jgi:mRNA interferase ChpB